MEELPAHSLTWHDMAWPKASIESCNGLSSDCSESQTSNISNCKTLAKSLVMQYSNSLTVKACSACGLQHIFVTASPGGFYSRAQGASRGQIGSPRGEQAFKGHQVGQSFSLQRIYRLSARALLLLVLRLPFVFWLVLFVNSLLVCIRL